jgi:hypothetical protein
MSARANGITEAPVMSGASFRVRLPARNAAGCIY